MKKFFLFYALILIIACRQKQPASTGLSPQEAVRSFELAEGFQIELIASEPLVADPVAMEVDEQGRFFVLEMHGYPEDLSGSGKVKLLKDTDGNGLPDKSIVFADSLVLPTGIMKWKKGILVVDVPNVWYLEDSDGDDRADIKKLLLTGFARTNPQHIANTPLLGIDNWIYIAHQGSLTPKVSMIFNDTGTLVRYADRPNGPQLPRDADGRNIRFQPDKGLLEMLSGESQYGHTFDEWGHHICTSNADHLFHEVIDAAYLQRNPNLLVADATQNIPDHGDAAEIFPVTVNPENQLLTDVGVITSSCGVTWYQGGLFPDSFNDVTFIAEPVHNLVHADRITGKGATFTASRVYPQKEFLASKDPWFRPVQFYIGPEGALYVIDYYRQIVEHPEWMSEEVNRSGALYNGTGQGRIYRITPKGVPASDWMKVLAGKKYHTEDLVSFLGYKNIWWRKLGQRLLNDRSDSSIVAHVDRFFDTTASAEGLVHALWILENKGYIRPEHLLRSMKHTTAGVRENAIRIAEKHLQQWPEMQRVLFSMGDDPDPKVRYQLLCTLGSLPDPRAAKVRDQLLMRDINDDWVQVAALTAARSPADLILSVRAMPEGMDRYLEKASALVVLSQQEEAIKRITSYALDERSKAPERVRTSILSGLLKGLEGKRNVPSSFEAYLPALALRLQNETGELLRSLSMKLYAFMVRKGAKPVQDLAEKAVAIASDTSAASAYRIDALRVMVTDSSDRVFEVFEQLISPSTPQAVQLQAVKAYSQLDPLRAGRFYISQWATFSSDLRMEAIETFFGTPAAEQLLLDAVEQKKVSASHIDWQHSVWLMNEDDEKVRKRARTLLASTAEKDRDEIIKAYAAALEMKGDPEKGHALFRASCSTCHQVGGKEGIAFGPDLASIRNRDPRFIMADILNPNRSIADKYESWNIVTGNGERFSGIISSETSGTITLTQAGGKQITLPRGDIKSMEASSTSAMPGGFEATLKVEEMAHLLAYLKGDK